MIERPGRITFSLVLRTHADIPRPVRSWHTQNFTKVTLPWYVAASSNMSFCSPSKIYGAQAPITADRASSTLSAPAAIAGSGFTNGFEFANPAENVTAPWSSQPLNPLELPDLSQPNEEEPWSELRTRGERTHSCDAKMMQAAPMYVSGGALSDCGTLASRHAVSDSAYVSGASGSRLYNNQVSATTTRARRGAARSPLPARQPFACAVKDCGRTFKCKSDFG